MGQHRHIYLEDVPFGDVLRRFYARLEAAGALARTPPETVALDAALGRVTAASVWARISAPHYHGAAMDGIAVRAEDTFGASETAPARLRLGAQAVWVDTGDPVPPGFNAVVMLEDLHQVGAEEVEILAATAPWRHVRAMGEDIVATELVLPEGQRIGPADLGALAASGQTTVQVRRRPRVAIIPTGSELVPPTAEPQPGQIIEFNSLMLAGQVAEWGGEPVRWPIVPDERARIHAAVVEALASCDLVLVNAGSSAGSEDYTAAIIAELGEVLAHGAAIRPGHPLILGLARGKPVLGIPGYPVSAVVTSELVVQPLLATWLGLPPLRRPRADAVMTRKVLSPLGLDEYLRVKLGRVGGRYVTTPLQRGAGIVMSLVRADGVVLIPRFSEGVHAGSTVSVELLRDLAEIERTVVAIGSHDVALDVLANRLRQHSPGANLASANVGSIGGLLALMRDEAHLAGSHLLDEQTGAFIVSYVERYLPGRAVVLVNLVHRRQGLIVAPGNPKGIAGLADLARPDVSFVNRQKGAGTRVLLDFKLRELGVDPRAIQGYEREEYTHLAVAAAVSSGVADVGLGILAAARALHLDFVPLLEERYDLVIPREHYESDLLAPLLAVIRSAEFGAEVEALGGYDARDMGRVMAEIGG
ncbi:MAG: molybdopterin biosynthesis protein [Chloroflexi bacterium]|nr:molybdopterin biosynthesis protein [Chloroflexota bacterium]